MNYIKFEDAIEEFQTSFERKIQLDLFRESGEVLLQVFKGYDVLNWKFDIGEIQQTDSIFLMFFKPSRKNNENDYERLLNTEYLKDFVEVTDSDRQLFFLKVKGSESSILLHQKVEQVISDVYELPLTETNFTLRGF